MSFSSLLEQALVKNIDKVEMAEINSGPACLHVDRLPARNDYNAMLLWLDDIVTALLSASIVASKNNKSFFGKASERAINKINKKLKSTQSIYKSEYNKQKEDLKNRLSDLMHQIDTYAQKSDLFVKKLKYLTDSQKLIEKLLQELDSKTIMDDPVTATPRPAAGESDGSVKGDGSATDNSDNSTDSTNSSNSNGSNDFTNSNPNQGSDNSQEKDDPQDKDYDCKGKPKELPQDCHEARNRDNDQNNVQENDSVSRCPLLAYTNNGKLKLEIYNEHGYVLNPRTGLLEKVWFLNSKMRCAKIMHETIQTLNEVKSSVMIVRNKHGDEWEINSASTPDLRLTNTKGEVVAYLDSDLQLKPDTKENKKLKNELCKKFGYSSHLSNILTIYNDDLVISPTEYHARPFNIYGMRPLFVGSGMSEQYAVKYMVDYITLKTSKSSMATREIIANGDNAFSREYKVNILTDIIRCLRPLAQDIRHKLFIDCQVWHNDESTWRCLETLKNENGQIRQNNYIWALVTGKHEQKQGAVFLNAVGRDKDEFMRQFMPDFALDTWDPYYYSINTIVTDAYSAYPPGIAMLEEYIGHPITHAGCFAHLRRYLLDALRLMKLESVFLNICDVPFDQYGPRLREEIKRQNIKLGKNGDELLFMTFLIETILCLDCDFALVDKEHLAVRRERSSKPVLETFYCRCENMLKRTPSIIKYKDKSGVEKYKGGNEYPWGKALIYAMNNKQALSEFLDNPDIECQNNIAELQLRSAVIHRRNMMFLVKQDSFKAYCDLLTIIQTCKLNDINPYVYIQWYIDNVKLRMEQYRLSGAINSTAQLCVRPKVGSNGNKKDVSRYDPSFYTEFDEIDISGLDPWSFIDLLTKEHPRRIKKA